MVETNYEIKRTNLYEQIADSLERAIIAKDSDLIRKLPSEQELAKRFQVSRTVVREGLKILKERGLIDLRNGGGSYITKPKLETVSSALQRIIEIDEVNNEDLHELRHILEVAACRLAAVHITAEEVARLREIVACMEDRSLSVDERVEYDSSFHIAIARAGKNILLEMFVEVMTTLTREYMSKGVLLRGGIEDCLKHHNLVVNAIESGDPDKAEGAISDHLRASHENVTIYDSIKNPDK
ncbi:GntR family transcriptional regulator [Alkalispirochaeta sphaeroplastigenens]|uniref:GntR family transcriptional regulator n=1 Tax=Alkalispirochaeta sphaeroplastigenens TaxID=1187066 RepID=A0A2S4JIA0_9SPIO|nr:FadR/GntR family transcriptional regulator [Alkalispirochaeta sphaeroplastigenens]POQ99189.1 GntR family transcriptional regulator [Alkalispirochaeta sphaeroplastigenens]